MKKNLSLYMSVVATLFILMIFTASPVLACSPAEEAMNLTLEDRVHNAPMILVGRVVQGYTTSYGGYEVNREVDVEVERYLRGTGPALVRISGFGDGADCLTPIQVGAYAVFFVEGNPDETLDAVYLGVHDATWNVNEENIETITAITGENNEPYPLSFTSQLLQFVTQYAIWFIALAILVIVLGFAPFVLHRIRNPRKSKMKRS